MAKISVAQVLGFAFKHSAGIMAAVALEGALTAKPRNSTTVRNAVISLIAAEAPNINTKDPDLRTAIDNLVTALAKAGGGA